MTAKLSIELDDSVLDALMKTGSITFRIVPDNPSSSPTGTEDAKTPREGSLPAQVLAWAAEDREPFTTPEVMEAFGLSRAHASNLLGMLANGAYPLRRVRRGVYRYEP
jgi:hypothetical protein